MHAEWHIARSTTVCRSLCGTRATNFRFFGPSALPTRMAIRRDEGDATDQSATLSGLWHASAMPVQLDQVVEARHADR